jgi:hypothetical protein
MSGFRSEPVYKNPPSVVVLLHKAHGGNRVVVGEILRICPVGRWAKVDGSGGIITAANIRFIVREAEEVDIRLRGMADLDGVWTTYDCGEISDAQRSYLVGRLRPGRRSPRIPPWAKGVFQKVF